MASLETIIYEVGTFREVIILKWENSIYILCESICEIYKGPQVIAYFKCISPLKLLNGLNSNFPDVLQGSSRNFQDVSDSLSFTFKFWLFQSFSFVFWVMSYMMSLSMFILYGQICATDRYIKTLKFSTRSNTMWNFLSLKDRLFDPLSSSANVFPIKN